MAASLAGFKHPDRTTLNSSPIGIFPGAPVPTVSPRPAAFAGSVGSPEPTRALNPAPPSVAVGGAGFDTVSHPETPALRPIATINPDPSKPTRAVNPRQPTVATHADSPDLSVPEAPSPEPFAAQSFDPPRATNSAARRIAVVGAGPAGLSCAITAAQNGHHVTLFEPGEIGGQLNLARKIPGKEEYNGLVAWYRTMVETTGVHLRRQTATPQDLTGFDVFVVATGVTPRSSEIDGQDHALSYLDVLNGAPTGP
ncbi:MAG: FAD-dependent oxidoreductase, partial [Candidatus Saccharibacteria bacterium]|nr:FAD-dependent oxidoreductase [Pseudorhodobacter sp.]